MTRPAADQRARALEIRTLRKERDALARRNAELVSEVHLLRSDLRAWQGQALALRRLDETQPGRRLPQSQRHAARAEGRELRRVVAE